MCTSWGRGPSIQLMDLAGSLCRFQHDATATHIALAAFAPRTPTPRRSITMADTIEQLKDKLQALEADSGGNKDRKKLEVALELCAALAALDMKRGVVQYADLAIDLDGDCVPAHCFRAEALQAMAQQRPSSKAAAKAAKACARAWRPATAASRSRGCPRIAQRLERARAALGDAPPPPPKKASTKSRAQPPQKLENAVVDLS